MYARDKDTLINPANQITWYVHDCLVVYALYFKHFELFVDLLSNVKRVRKHTYNRREDEKSPVAFLIGAYGP